MDRACRTVRSAVAASGSGLCRTDASTMLAYRGDSVVPGSADGRRNPPEHAPITRYFATTLRRVQPLDNLLGCLLRGRLLAEDAFPDHEHAPPDLLEHKSLPSVAFLICFELLRPECRSRCRHIGMRASVMLMPEAAVNENYCSKLCKHQIGPAGKGPAMKSKSNTCAMESCTQDAFGHRVLAPDPRHIVASLSRCQSICHVSPSR
jgi:hypothetical protein